MSADRLRILAVDDEQTQLHDLARLLRTFSAVEEVECAFDGHDVLRKASTHRYDAIFLDVRMPGLDGLELGQVLRRFTAPPELVFVSAYDSAAVDAFELRALDYLRKPVSHRRLGEAVERVVAAVEATSAPAGQDGPDRASHRALSDGEMVAVANLRNGSTRVISRHDILFVQSNGDFVRILTEEGRYLLRATLHDIETRWEPFGFVRVHRQYVVNLAQAVELRPLFGGTAELTLRAGHTIPVARRHVADLSRRLGV